MSYFGSDFLTFFKELENNNNKEWFHAHKKDYEEQVKKPFKDLVEEIILRIKEFDPELDIEPKQAIFRINRDIRFSKDKTPYKSHVGAMMSKGGKMSHYPGYYVHLSNKSVMIGGGAHGFDREKLEKVRKYIAKNPGELTKIIEQADFKKKFKGIKGEKNKRLAPEFQKVEETQPLIANKSFHYGAKLDAKTALKNNLPDILIDYFKTGKSFNDYFKKALD